MSDRSPNLNLPYILPSQAQKHVTHNEALRLLDVIAQLSVLSATTETPPTTAQDGDRYIVPDAALGEWAGKSGEIAVMENAAWQFITPQDGWQAWVADTDTSMLYASGNWAEQTTSLPETIDRLGVSTTPDANNPFAVSGDAVLLSHDGAGMQLKLNKAAATDTASLLFQTNWGGRAELGTTGSDDLAIRVSPDGATFHTAMTVENGTGIVSFPQGTSNLAPAAFGEGPLVTAAYIGSRGLDLVTNGTGGLGNSYNYPPDFQLDSATTPNLPASFYFEGYYNGPKTMTETIPIDPNQAYRLGVYVRQEGITGDFSAFAEGNRHRHLMGLVCYDLDGNEILARNHMRYRQGGVDSMTTLTAPLSPGDTVVSVSSVAGWNTTSAAPHNRGLTIFGHRNTQGYLYDFYTRLVEFELFNLGAVDSATNSITLSQQLPTTLANPDHPNGTWPVGTRIANSSSSGSYKYAYLGGSPLAKTDTWYSAVNYMGGIDQSGTNAERNFSPGTAACTILWLPNFSNRAGGWSSYPDTGATQKVWFTGTSVRPTDVAQLQPSTAPSQQGSYDVKVMAEGQNGAVVLEPASLSLQEL